MQSYTIKFEWIFILSLLWNVVSDAYIDGSPNSADTMTALKIGKPHSEDKIMLGMIKWMEIAIHQHTQGGDSRGHGWPDAGHDGAEEGGHEFFMNGLSVHAGSLHEVQEQPQSWVGGICLMYIFPYNETGFNNKILPTLGGNINSFFFLVDHILVTTGYFSSFCYKMKATFFHLLFKFAV